MNIFNPQVSGYVDPRQRTIQLEIRSDVAAHPDILYVEKPRKLRNRGPLQLNAEAQLVFFAIASMQHAPRYQVPEPLRDMIRTRRLAPKRMITSPSGDG